MLFLKDKFHPAQTSEINEFVTVIFIIRGLLALVEKKGSCTKRFLFFFLR